MTFLGVDPVFFAKTSTMTVDGTGWCRWPVFAEGLLAGGRRRRVFAQDFYLLIPQTQTLDTWSAWQFHDPRNRERFVQAFRMESGQQARRIVLKGIGRAGQYQFTDAYTGQTFLAAAAQLTSAGVKLRLPKISSRVLMYRKVARSRSKP